MPYDPAFPIVVPEGNVDEYFYGLTKRDWFAGLALQGFLTGAVEANSDIAEIDNFEGIAGWAYKMADAMIQEREK